MLNNTPIMMRPNDDGSGTAAEGRKSVAPFTLPTMTEKSPVSLNGI